LTLKNTKLNEERVRKYAEKKKEEQKTAQEEVNNAIHPSRMARMKATGAVK
jgi:hypothetical protein